MFTLEQIKAAHSKVKTGADFPAYIQDMKKLGLASYEHYVSDGHIDYNGSSDFILSAPPKWNAVAIGPKGQKTQRTFRFTERGMPECLVKLAPPPISGVQASPVSPTCDLGVVAAAPGFF